MPSSDENQARLHQAYADLLDEEATSQNGSNASLLTLVGGLDRMFEPYRLANPPVELSRSIDLLARELATNDRQPAPSHFWQIGPFGNRGDGGSGRPNLPSDDTDDHDPEPPRRWSLGRELAGIAAVIVILALVGGALVAVFRGQNGSSSSPAALASPAATSQYPPLPELAKNNPGAEAVYKAGLGKHVHLTYSNHGYTWTIHWVYADAVQMIAFYTVTAPANVDIKDADLSTGLIFADSAGRKYGGADYAGMTLSANRSLDVLVWASKNRPLATDGPTIKLKLDLDPLLLRSKSKPHEVSSTVAHGTSIEVTVPYDIGHEISVGKQATLDGVPITLDHLRVAPSGVQAFFLYPQGSSVASKSVWGQLSGGSPGSPLCQPTSWSDSVGRLVFPCAPPRSDAGDWSITLQPYDETGGPTKDKSKWLTFTFPANPGASVATILPAQPLPSTLKTDGNSIGDPNAPVKVVEWGDYQCSACHYFYQNGRAQFLKDYVATGKVYYTFRDFPFFGKQSENAAVAAWCANDQGKYWEFHDTMYGNQPPEGKKGITDTFLRAVAKSAGLNLDRFNQCNDSGKYKSKVQDELAQAKDLKIYGTPTFFVNGSRVDSADYSQLKSTVETTLEQCSAAPGTSCVPPEFIGSPPAQSNAAATPNATPTTASSPTATATPTASRGSVKNIPAAIGAEGLREAYAAGFGVTPNTVEAVANAKIAVKWAYADSRVAFVTFDITGLSSPAPPTPSSANIGSCMTDGTVSTNSKPGIASPANRLGGYGGGWQGDILHCSASWFAAYGHELDPTTTSITMHINGKLGDAGATPYTLTQKIPVIRARVAAPHLQGEVNGQPVTLDRVVVTPSATMFFLHGPGAGKPVPGASTPVPRPDRFLINGAGSSIDLPKDSETFVGGLTAPGSSEYVYTGYYAEPAKPGPWTIEIMATDANGKVVTDPAKIATFTVNLPAANWIAAASATPTP